MIRNRLAFAFLALFAAVTADAAGAAPKADKVQHRYMIERTFPAGALDGVDAAKKAEVNKNNAKYDVKWVLSYANEDKTKTYCVYEAPNELAIHQAAKANGLPVDRITEIPGTLDPQ